MWDVGRTSGPTSHMSQGLAGCVTLRRTKEGPIASGVVMLPLLVMSLVRRWVATSTRLYCG